MNNLMQSRIASMAIAVIGAWLLISPAVITLSGAALISVMAIGAFFVAAGVVQFFWENTLPSWATAIVAVWLIGSTIVFNLEGAALWSQAVTAVAAFIVATWDGVEIDQVRTQHQHAHI